MIIFPLTSRDSTFTAGYFFGRNPLESREVPLEDAPNRRYAALKVFASRLKIKPETGTRLIEVSYSDPDPHLATAVVNHLLQALTDFSYKQRMEETAQASSRLAAELTVLRRQTRLLQDKANRLQREAGIYGDDPAHNVVTARLDALNQRVAAAESTRLLAEAVDRISQSGDSELISALAGGVTGGSPVGSSLVLIENLRTKEAAVRAEIAESGARYGDAHPRIGELRSELDGIEQSIQEEVGRIGKRSLADFEVAEAAETSARDAFEKQKVLADAVSGHAANYQLARQEADSNRGVYEALLARLSEANVLEGLHSTNLAIINPGRVPPTHHPKSPNVPLCYAAALVGGLLLGFTGALTSELTDHTVRSLDELERFIDSPLLGVLPLVERADRLRYLLSPRDKATSCGPLFLPSQGTAVYTRDAHFLESLRSLRTSLLLLRPGRRSQVVLVTSSIAGEGKSMISINLAGILAQLGARVLLVDADLRRPSVFSELNLGDATGLDAALLDDVHPQIHRYEPQRNLSVLCGHEASRMPAELLASQKMADLLMQWRDEYDFVILDSPPLLFATDALVLAQVSDITLLVARHGFTAKRAVHRSFSILRDQIPETSLIRMVLNGVHAGSDDLRAYYGYEPSARDYAHRGMAS